MKKFRSILGVAAFTLAITGAFASEFLVADPGYARKADVQAQGGAQLNDCKFIQDCPGGNVACKVTFVSENQKTVNNIQLYRDPQVVPCAVPLFRQ